MIHNYVTEITDESVNVGQYRHVSTRAWWLVQIDDPSPSVGVYLAEHMLDQWIPYSWEDQWTLRRRTSGRVIRLSPGEPKSPEPSILHSLWPSGEWYAPGGNFQYRGGDVSEERTHSPSWSNPNPKFIAEAPLEPTALLEHLSLSAHGVNSAPENQFRNALNILRTGLAPASLRNVLFDALISLPDIDVVPGVINTAGTPTIAITRRTSTQISMILVGQETGQFLGEHQQVAGSDLGDLPPGTTITSTSVSISVVAATPPDLSRGSDVNDPV